MATPQTSINTDADLDCLARLHTFHKDLKARLAQRIIGQEDLIEHLIITLLGGGHALFVGVPGLAKTRLIQALAEALHLDFSRVQFTPDLMPADITGSEIVDQDTTGKRHFRFVQGPLFCNLLLADEINRTPPKTQSALLQAMQEHTVTVGGQTHVLAQPFHVFATQNPIEQEGTYPLPEAQLDRFLMMLKVDYPSADEEAEIVSRTTCGPDTPLEPIANPKTLQDFQRLVTQVPATQDVVAYAVRLVRSTRPHQEDASPEVKECLAYGSGPRGAQHLVLTAKARALLHHRTVVDIDDIKVLALPVLRHRLILSFHGEAQRIQTDQLLTRLIEQCPS